MFIFAHIFAGALLGLLFWRLANDRRALPFCIAGSVLPDLIDKSLGLLFPSVLASGRTVFHTLLIVLIILLSAVLFFRSVSRILVAGVGGAVLLHQIFDEMWTLPANWFYPLMGPFQGHMIPDYVGTYFWFEITNPSEWLFMIGTVLILAASFKDSRLTSYNFLSDRMKTVINRVFAAVFIGTGLYLVIAGFATTSMTCITPEYLNVPTVIAGALFLCGAGIMTRIPLFLPNNQF